MNKNQILYRSEKGYSIREGMTYFAILKNNMYYSLEEMVAGEEEPITIKQRWLKLEPAQRIVETLNTEIKAEQEKKKAEEAKIKEEALKKEEEEKAKRGNQIQQVRNINTDEDFNQWLVNNNLRLEVLDSSNITIYNGADVVAYLKSAVTTVPHCCGGKEHGSHSAYFKREIFEEFTLEEYNKIFSFIAKEYDRVIDNCQLIKGYFTTSFIKCPNDISINSAMWGLLFSHSKYFTKVGHFMNRNTNRELDVYVTNSNFTGYEI